MSDQRSTQELEQNLAEVARALFTPGTVAGTLQLTVDLAVATVEGCDAAGVYLVQDQQVVTAAASHPLVDDLDKLQFTSHEGPCLDAVADGVTTYAADLADDPRWPVFGPAAASAGIRSVYALRLSSQPIRALNLYAHLPGAFGTTDRAKGLIFATLATLALETADERGEDELRLVNLHRALATRELIGQAQGILIERERITGDQAFDVLRRASQHLNIKIREVASTLIETGETPATGPRRSAP
ncbi:MAG: GAF and ANTAR domain-containing protein [Aquihabitans sp.]